MRLIVLLLSLTVLAGVVPAAHADAAATAAAGERPRVGLVLSGGGARGGAHIGVLKVLEAERIRIDAIAGTSMGAVVGGLYASGLSAAEIESLMFSDEWRDAFREPGPRDRRSFRRKSEDRDFRVNFPLGIEAGSFRLPKSLLTSQRLTQALRKRTLPVAAVRDFDRLPTPFRAMATDLETGEPVELRGGDLVTAIRASLSAPGLFEPVDLDGKLLVDGGLANNLPVEVARAMGVDVLIVVDVGFPLRKRDGLESVATITNQMLAIAIRGGSDAQRKLMREGDILLAPALGDASTFDFEVLRRAAGLGEEAARASLGKLAALRMPEAGYADYVAQRTAKREALELPPGEVRIAADSTRYEPLLRAPLATAASATAAPAVAVPDAAALDTALTEVYGRGNFSRVDYIVEPRDGRGNIVLDAERNSWGPNYIRFGLGIEDDFSGNAAYNAAARIVLADIGAYGAEWVWDLQIGSEPRIATEYHQPLDARGRWFVAPQARFEVRDVPVLRDAARVAEYRLRNREFGIDVGRELGNWGEVRAGLRRVQGHSRLRIGDPASPPGDRYDDREYFARLSFDTLDSRNFPRHGESFTAEWRGERSDLGTDGDAELLTADWLLARSTGRHTAVLWTTFGSNFGDDGTTNVRTLLPLGGFLNLSGLAPGAISGRHVAIARALYLRQIGRRGEGFLDVPTYVGVSLEAGNAWSQRSDIGFGSALAHGSVFLGLDTLLGPVYLGTGFGEGGENTFYLFLGRTF
ncbi:MAG: patatin-like phospholipase family protein [Gammaproteobacteria bacterium]